MKQRDNQTRSLRASTAAPHLSACLLKDRIKAAVHRLHAIAYANRSLRLHGVQYSAQLKTFNCEKWTVITKNLMTVLCSRVSQAVSQDASLIMYTHTNNSHSCTVYPLIKHIWCCKRTW